VSLEDLRKDIDDIDTRVVKLLAERERAARKIGALKRKGNRQVHDAARENKVIEHIRQLAVKEDINPENVERLYQMVMAASRSVQGTEVAFQGQDGAYSQEAALDFFAGKGLAHYTVSTAVANRQGLKFYAGHGLEPLQTVLLGRVQR